MELRHRLLAHRGAKYDLLKEELKRLGLKYKFNPNSFLSSIEFEFSDQEPFSSHLLAFAKSNDLWLASALEYSEEEIRTANWVVVLVGESQYPQPEGSFGFREATYDLTHYCRNCGQGAVQANPFRLMNDFGKRTARFLGIHWVRDEIFVRPEIKTIFEDSHISGVSFAEVVRHKSGKPFENLLQLKIDTLADPAWVTDDLFRVTCKPQNEESHLLDRADLPYCGRVKYRWPSTKPLRFKSSALAKLPDFAKSTEYFGSGGAANRFILARSRVLKLVSDLRLRGLYAKRPVHLV